MYGGTIKPSLFHGILVFSFHGSNILKFTLMIVTVSLFILLQSLGCFTR